MRLFDIYTTKLVKCGHSLTKNIIGSYLFKLNICGSLSLKQKRKWRGRGSEEIVNRLLSFDEVNWFDFVVLLCKMMDSSYIERVVLVTILCVPSQKTFCASGLSQEEKNQYKISSVLVVLLNELKLVSLSQGIFFK